MKENNFSLLSRRDWLKTVGVLSLSAAASTVAMSRATNAEKHDLIYHRVLKAASWSTRYGLGAVVFQDRLWVLGGTGTLHNGTQFNDV